MRIGCAVAGLSKYARRSSSIVVAFNLSSFKSQAYLTDAFKDLAEAVRTKQLVELGQSLVDESSLTCTDIPPSTNTCPPKPPPQGCPQPPPPPPPPPPCKTAAAQLEGAAE